jgi:hypothetical protein
VPTGGGVADRTAERHRRAIVAAGHGAEVGVGLVHGPGTPYYHSGGDLIVDTDPTTTTERRRRGTSRTATATCPGL